MINVWKEIKEVLGEMEELCDSRTFERLYEYLDDIVDEDLQPTNEEEINLLNRWKEIKNG